MKKTQINVSILLPEIPSENDACVDRIIALLQSRRGIDKVHIKKETADQAAQLCFHYDPSLISSGEIETLAREAGASITEQYGHLIVESSAVWEPRYARRLELGISRLPGVLNVSISGTGFIQLEYEKQRTEKALIMAGLARLGIPLEPKKDTGPGPESVERFPSTAHHGGVFGEKTELVFAITAGVFLGAGFAFSFVDYFTPTHSFVCYLAAYFFGGFYTSKEAIGSIRKGQFEIDFLMLVAAAGAAALGQWSEGALLLFLFSLGHSLEHYAMGKARKTLAALTELTPKVALLKVGSTVKEVPIDALKPGDIIVVKPHSVIPADGVVVKGRSMVNQAPLTGESMPVNKEEIVGRLNLLKTDLLDEKHRVFSSTLNGGQVLEVQVSKGSENSTIARLIQLVNEAQTQKSPTQTFTDKIEKYYVPAVLIFIVVLLFAFIVLDEPFSASFYRAMSVLVAASPCALAIATPSAVLSGVARAAKGGVLIKGGKPLEDLGEVKAIAFDKTGTLTEGKPKLTGVYPLGGISEHALLILIVAVEKLNDHPLAAAIVKGGMEKLKEEVPPADQGESIVGRGVQASYESKVIYIGNKELFEEKNLVLPLETLQQVEAFENSGHTTMIVSQEERIVGIITLMDVARSGAKDVLNALKRKGIATMVMLTGDNQRVAASIAQEIGITEAWGSLLPEEKVAAIDRLLDENGKVAMVGDGVNDAPAMAKSTVGIAMGAAGSDVALETADIALMTDQLNRLPFAIGLSRKAKGIIRQNLIISLGMVMVLIPLTLFGYATIGPAIIGHEGSTLVVVFNALRLLTYD